MLFRQLEYFVALARERHFARAGSRQVLRFFHHRLEAPAAKLPTQLRNDAEATGMITPFGNLDIRGMLWGRDNARSQIVIEKRRRLRRQNF